MQEEETERVVEDFLAHYGKKGMRWGVLNEEDSSPSSKQKVKEDKTQAKQAKRETKALGFESRAAKSNIRISELENEIKNLPPGVKTAYKRTVLQGNLKDTTNYRDSLLKDAVASRNGKLTSNQKKLILGGIAVAGIAGFMAYNAMSDSGQANSLKLRGAAFLSGKKFEFAKNPELSRKDFSPAQVLTHVGQQVNPNYSTPGGQMNCRRSTFTHELRRRGYDVAATTSPVGWGQSESGLINALTIGTRDRFSSASLSSMVVGGDVRGQIKGDRRSNPAETVSIKKFQIAGDGRNTDNNNIMAALSEQPNGSRGEVVFNFRSFGHSMAYEIFDGKPVIFDSQKGTMYDGDTGFTKLSDKWGMPSGAEITRLDNIPLDMKFLSRWATNARSESDDVIDYNRR